MPIVREETFGPVQTLQVFDTEEEAIRMANDSEYGLVSIDSWASLAIEVGKGGYKASGTGRLGGTASLDDFLEYKQITQNFGPPAHR